MSDAWTALERAYSPSSCVADMTALLEAYRSSSALARQLTPPRTYQYGSLECESLDLFSAGPNTPVHVFIHGGYWQELDRADSSFPAPGFVSAGVSYVALGYGLAPAFDLDAIVAQVRAALAWLYDDAAALGVDRTRIVVSGSSAGAQLAAMAALTDWTALGCPPDVVRGLVLMSGIYDLGPLLDTYINDAVHMDRAIAYRNSPIFQLRPRLPKVPAIVAWGQHETDAFKRQSARFADAWHAAGHPVVRLEVSGRNHFDIVHDLSDPATALGRAVQAASQEWGWI